MILIYDLAIVEDRGSYYQVVGVTKNSFDLLANKTDTYLKLSEVAYRMIKDATDEGKSIRIVKPLSANEVLPNEVVIVDVEKTDVEAAIDSAVIRVRKLVTFELSKVSGFTLYEFNTIHTELLEDGFFITNKNREQKYIEIIETGNIEIIEKLERYLEAKDTLDRAYSIKTRVDKFVSQIKKLTSVDEIREAENKFVSDFYANA